MHERHTVVKALPILYVLKEGTTDVLKRPKIYYRDTFLHLQLFHFVCNAQHKPSLCPLSYSRDGPQEKTTTPTREPHTYRNGTRRCSTRIALLLTHAQDDKEEEVPVAKNPQHYYCQTTCCFCVLLLLMNLLFLQWLYYKVHNVKL